VRLYYATQVDVGPPTIVISASAPKSISEPYKRYLTGVFQKRLPFREVPVRLLLRGKKAEDKA
jgi:GTP-binding protein